MEVLPTQLTFQPGETELCIQITIIDDVILEDNETFSVGLITTDQAVILNPSSATVTILNNDSESGSISATKNIEPIATKYSKASMKSLSRFGYGVCADIIYRAGNTGSSSERLCNTER